jgi:hypothetical protein
MNYRNEYDRLHGELHRTVSPDLIRGKIHMMMDHDKLKAIGMYDDSNIMANPLGHEEDLEDHLVHLYDKVTPGVRIRPGEREDLEVSGKLLI